MPLRLPIVLGSMLRLADTDTRLGWLLSPHSPRVAPDHESYSCRIRESGKATGMRPGGVLR